MEARRISAEDTRDLRHRVLWPHLKSMEECTIDIDHRADAIHIGAFDGDRIISVLSLFETSTPKLKFEKQYRLRVMGTDPEYAGKGAGKLIVEKAVEVIQEKGYDLIWCDARKVAVGFYDRLGFEIVGDWYEVPEIGLHKTMYFKIEQEQVFRARN